MRKEVCKVLTITVMLMCIMAGCKKEREEAEEQTVLLRDKSVDEAKAFVRGNWTIHYTYGGLTGNMKTSTPHSHLSVLANDSIYLTFNHQLLAADKASFQRSTTIFGYTAVLMQFTSLSNLDHEWVIDSKKGDTLVLVNHATEPVAYYMTKTD
jgi:hypothetical protein